jgi:putative addiction module component (TIGR02574 family)
MVRPGAFGTAFCRSILRGSGRKKTVKNRSFVKNTATMSATALKEEVRKMSAAERILFVQYILDTLREDAGEAALSEEWKQELDRRTASYLDGTAKTYTWEEVRNKVLQQ